MEVSAKAQGFHYWPPKFNSKDSALVFVLELFVLFLSLKQEMEPVSVDLKVSRISAI